MTAGQDIVLLDPRSIEADRRVRVDLGDIAKMAKGIGELGQLQPILVKDNGDGRFEIIAGLRRMRACEKLGIPVKAIVVEPEDELQQMLMQLRENVDRKDFDLLELAEGLRRLKALYEQRNPETRRGATGGGRGGKGARSKTGFADPAKPVAERFTLTAREVLGCGERKIQELLQIANLPEADKATIAQPPTTSARNKAAQEVLRQVRQRNKEDRLRKRSGTSQEKEGTSTVVLHRADNRDVLPTLEPKSFQVISTDGPYERGKSLISHINRGSISSDFGEWDRLDVGWVLRAAPLLAQGGHLLAHCPLEAIGDYETICQQAGLTYRCAIIWHKTNPGTVHRPVYLSSCEAIVWATKGERYYLSPWENAGSPEVHNFIEGPICQGNERLDHPTQKPLWLVERILRRHARAGDRVLDLFAGVGTTLVACKRLGLLGVGIEREGEYVRLARLRLNAYEDT